MSDVPLSPRPRAKTRLYAIAGLAGGAMLVTVPMFMQAFAGALHASQTDDVLLSLPLLSWVHARTGWNLTVQLWWGFAIVVCGYAALVAACEWIIRRWLDRDDDAWTCVLWALGSWRGWLPWLGVFTAGTAVALGVSWLLRDSRGAVPVMLIWLPVVGVVVALPFTTWNLDNLRSPRPPRRWRARWPGAAPVLAIIAVQIAAWITRIVSSETHISGAGAVVLGLAFNLLLWVPLLILDTVLLLAWLERARMKDGDDLLRKAMRSRVLAPVVAFDLRLSLLTGMLTLPVLPISMLLIFIVPQLQETLGGQGGFGTAWSTWVVAARWISRWWWMTVVALAMPFLWYLLVAHARLLVQVGATGQEGSDAIE
jgi:hypothetical protein